MSLMYEFKQKVDPYMNYLHGVCALVTLIEDLIVYEV